MSPLLRGRDGASLHPEPVKASFQPLTPPPCPPSQLRHNHVSPNVTISPPFLDYKRRYQPPPPLRPASYKRAGSTQPGCGCKVERDAGVLAGRSASPRPRRWW